MYNDPEEFSGNCLLSDLIFSNKKTTGDRESCSRLLLFTLLMRKHEWIIRVCTTTVCFASLTLIKAPAPVFTLPGGSKLFTTLWWLCGGPWQTLHSWCFIALIHHSLLESKSKASLMARWTWGPHSWWAACIEWQPWYLWTDGAARLNSDVCFYAIADTEWSLAERVPDVSV